MTPIQQLMLGTGSKKKVFIDDVFSSYVYAGNSTNGTAINTGVDMTKGGLLWIKGRNVALGHMLQDTVNGGGKYLASDTNSAQANMGTSNSFNNNGFTLGNGWGLQNATNYDYASWSFRKAPGFFDVVTYTGSGSTQQIAHNLGSIPGCYMIKCTSDAGSWMVYHRQLNNGVNAAHYRLMLDGNSSESDDNVFGDTAPTATHFTAGGGHGETNQSGRSYVCYLFAGGESDAATARSVDFDGSGDYLSLGSTTDLNLTGDFTIEFWVYPRNQTSGTRQSVINTTNDWGSQYAAVQLSHPSYVGKAMLWDYDMNSSDPIITSNKQIPEDQWTHVAFTRSSGTIKLWINGTLDKTATGLSDSIEFGHVTSYIANHSDSYYLDAKLSNLRIVKGTAVYTSSFRPPTEPLTNITNTKLLCCNNSSTTGSTVTPGTITANGDPTASSDSPFDDPAGFVFGENGDQNIIKSGSYVGTGSNLQDVFLGFEPQWVMIKCSSHSTDHTNWAIYDNMRGVVSGGDDRQLVANETDEEENGDNYANSDLIEFTSTGFKVGQSDWDVNHSANKTYVYIAIRRSDGYVGKPVDAGTDVFAMDTGNSSATQAFTSGFPVDFALYRTPASAENWRIGARLLGRKYLEANNSAAQGDSSWQTWDDNTGFAENTYYDSTFQAWMWSRGQGLDVVTYNGSNSAFDLPHNLGKTPEMIWFKSRSNAVGWYVYHKGLNGGTNPEQYSIALNTDAVETNQGSPGQILSLTSTHVGLNFWTGQVSQDNYTYTAMLFASVDGISSVGSFTGPDPEATITIDCGFQPRFVMIKCSSHARDWVVFDTVRGIAAGADKKLALNTNSAQVTTEDMIDLTSSGFSLPHGSYLDTNWPSREFIYYAHA